jgi:hypothetical protein
MSQAYQIAPWDLRLPLSIQSKPFSEGTDTLLYLNTLEKTPKAKTQNKQNQNLNLSLFSPIPILA